MMSLLCSLYGTVTGQTFSDPTASNAKMHQQVTIPQVDTGAYEKTQYESGYSIIFRHNLFYLLDRDGHYVNKKGYAQLREIYNNRAAFLEGDKWGYIDEKGNEIIPAQYSIVADFTKPTAAVLKDDNWSMIDVSGKHLYQLDPKKFLSQAYPSTPLSELNRLGNKFGSGSNINRVTAACPTNVNFEDGTFNGWNAWVGTTQCVFGNNVITWTPSVPTAARHTIIPQATPSGIDPWGFFPTNPPDGSNFCVKLGENGTTNRQAERIRYIIDVPPGTNSYSITYQYAVVFQNPAGHALCEQPRFIATLIDPATGANLGCATHQYVATASIPGFQNSTLNSSVKFKPWSSVFISLTPYAGRQVILEFSTADCTQGAHWGYAYVDVANTSCDLTAEVTYNCDPPHVTTITAPPGFSNYIWWNSDYTQQLGTSNTLVLNPGPPVGSLFHVEVFPFAGFGCRDTLPVIINSVIPSASFATPGPQCFANNNFNFTSTSTVGYGSITQHNWDFGDGNFGSGVNVSHSYAAPGNYTVKLVVQTATGCRDSVLHQISVESPSVAFSPPNGQCLSGNLFNFTSTSTVLNGTVQSQDWDFGDGNTATGASVSHTYSTAGTYAVKLVVTSGLGCKDSLIRNITVFPQPVPLYTIPAAQCLSNNSFNFVSSSTVSSGSVANVLWDFGDGNFGSGSPATHSYLAAGTYNVKMIAATDQGCRDSVTQTITVHAQPTADFVAPAAQCLSGNVYSFSDNSPGTITGHSWTFGDGGTATGSPATHTYGTAGNFTVQMVITDNNGCKDSTTRSVRVHPQPTLVPVFPAAQCLNGNNFTFQSNSSVTGGTVSSHYWDFGDASIATGPSVSHTYAAAGIYNVKLVVTSNNGCKDSVTNVVTVNSHPVGSLAQPASGQICDGGTQRLTATGGSVYQWYLNGNPIPNANAPVYDAPVSGTYSVSIVSAQGCPGVVPGSVTLVIVKKPVADFNFPFQCQGTPVLFNNRSDTTSAGPVTWSWFFGDGTVGSGTSPSHVFTSGGNFPVTLSVAPATCPNLVSTITKMVSVEGIRPGVRYPAVNTLSGTNTPLIARNFGQQYNWIPSVGLNDATIVNPVFNYNSQVDYRIKITTALGCVTYDTVLVRVFKMPDIQVPTGFSPNGDGHNDLLDVFLISIKELKYFRVYNRWGQLVFETKDASNRWDGRYRSALQPLETYVWIAEAVGTDGIPIVRRGQTILIR